MIRAEMLADGERCQRCGHGLQNADLRRVVTLDNTDILVVCQHCGEPSIILWSATREAS